LKWSKDKISAGQNNVCAAQLLIVQPSITTTTQPVMATATVQSHTHFLARDPLYDAEKPYSLRFTAPEGFPRANIRLERHGITVRDVRADSKPVTLSEDGCMLLDDFTTQMTYSDYDDEDKIKAVYLRDVANRLKALLNAQHVQIFEHTVGHAIPSSSHGAQHTISLSATGTNASQVRKRHATFPISTGLPYTYNQPTSIAHVDTTSPWAVAMAAQLNPSRATDLRSGKSRIQCVNFWRPITGPVQDWPLALCSATSIREPSKQLEPCDLVYPDYVVENRQVYHDNGYDWFYASEMMPNEAWVFLQSDTDPSTKPGM
jgi:hypothetical protein